MYRVNGYPERMRFMNPDTNAAIRESVGTIADRNICAYRGSNPIHRDDVNVAFWETVFDAIFLGASNPTDPWVWAGLVGDAVDGMHEADKVIISAKPLRRPYICFLVEVNSHEF